MPRRNALPHLEVTDEDIAQNDVEVRAWASVTSGNRLFVKMVSLKGDTIVFQLPPHLVGLLLRALKEILDDDPSRLDLARDGTRHHGGLAPAPTHRGA